MTATPESLKWQKIATAGKVQYNLSGSPVQRRGCPPASTSRRKTVNIKSGIANFKASPPRWRGNYRLHNYRASYRRGGFKEAARWWKIRNLPWRDASARDYIFNYRALMMAQKRGESWRHINPGPNMLDQTRRHGWNHEYPTGNTPFATWLRLHFWWPLPRPWRYFQACDCWKYQDTDYIEGMDGYYDPNPQEPEPCGGNRSRNGCAYA